MKYLLLSDIHGNLEALETVLAERTAEGEPEGVLVLGDLVGYGSDPAAVVARVRGLAGALVLRGNHDKVVAGLEEGQDFNDAALASARWSRQALGAGEIGWLAALPAGPLRLAGGVLAVHGSPGDEDGYILDLADAREALLATAAPLVLCGHSHLPLLARCNGRRAVSIPLRGERTEVRLESGCRYLFNPGSVGQPRDGDPRASFGLYDDAAQVLVHRRLRYPAEAAARKILEAGLPPFLSWRLLHGC